MKKIDCFMYFNEDLILDVRLNTLNPFIDNFVIVESNFTHSGEKKEFNFNINNYQKFKDKIIYIQVKDLPKNILNINVSEYPIVQNVNIEGIKSNKMRDQILENIYEEIQENYPNLSEKDQQQLAYKTMEEQAR